MLQCPFCETWFEPKNRVQQICGDIKCKKKRVNARTRLYIELHREHYKQLYKATYERNKVLTGYHRRDVETDFTCCYNCTFVIKKTDVKCRYCEVLVDEKKSKRFAKKEKKSYWDIVADNAKRAGKDPRKEIRKVKLERSLLNGFHSRFKKEPDDEDIKKETDIN